MMKSLATLFVAFVALVCLPLQANAQSQRLEINVTVMGHTGVVSGSPSDHFLSFSGPISIPGVSLAAGAYVFRLVAPSVMQVLSEDRSTAYAMFFVNRTARATATDQYWVTLRRIRNDAPARLAAIFPAYSLTGYEPMYPSLSATAPLAERTGVSEVGQVAMKCRTASCPWWSVSAISGLLAGGKESADTFQR